MTDQLSDYDRSTYFLIILDQTRMDQTRMTRLMQTGPQVGYWQWRGFSIRYQQAGDKGPALVLIHGFGASSDHWLKTIPELAQTCRVYAIDLIGFGRSAKPAPQREITYTFETWADQVIQFCHEVVQDQVFIIGNSIGCIVALQAAVDAPDTVLGLTLLNCSLRLLHVRKRSTLPWHRRYSTPVIQRLLGYRPIGHFFFSRLAKAKVLRQILLEAYGNKAAVTDELIQLLLAPAQDPGAADVFLAFIQYAQGPLPEDLIPQVNCPILIGWGTEDPWEPIELGRELATFSTVQDFVPITGVGHCPQDESPDLVNAMISEWLQQVYSSSR